jgi:DNA gyrase/topoisomerase IV subunit B
MPPKTIEETYKKLSQREHVLHRPGMYIGSIKKQMEELWVPNQEFKMEKKMVEYSPGFMKIFDEVLTNATDHSFRDSTVTQIKVDYNKETGEISVLNNGSGIPVIKHKEHDMYIPELIFGHLLSGSNYDDSNTRTGAGTNGLGSKVSNIYSKKFKIETLDSNSALKFTQEFSDNMINKTPAKITKNSGKSFTNITFTPDYSLFEMKGLEDDTILLINKRVFDCIACTNANVQVCLNGEKLKGKGLLDYTKYFFDETKVFSESFAEKYKSKSGESIEYIWEYAIVPYSHFEQVSFVNGNSTIQGGKHVDYIMYQIVSKLKTLLETKKKLKDVKPNFIKDKMFLFLRATVANPSFNSQSKEQLTTASKDFGCRVDVPDKFIDKLWKSSIVEDIVEFCKMKETMDVAKKTDGSKKNKIYIPKLEDALWAGTAKSEQCTLILTEGLSAMTFAMWGRSIVGPERYGAIPLKGKCLFFDTKIPLFNGEIKLAKDIQIGDTLIGDDGNKRNVLTLHKGNGKMYEVFQDRGESYKVNDEHILTLCMPEHKIIYWVPSNYTWRTIYWDKTSKNIKAKESQTSVKIKCKECGIMINAKSLKRHYTRKHKNVKYIPYKLENKDINDKSVIQARKKLEEFLSSIDSNNIIDICIGDYFNVTESFKRKLKGIRGECVNWENKEVSLDPYVLGLWLGDGMKSGYAYSCYGEKDPEIIDYLNEWGKNNDVELTLSKNNRCWYKITSIDNPKKTGYAPLKKLLSKYNLINNKHIPKDYLINSKEIRLKVLAGIIDTDGTVYPDGTIEISQSTKHQQLTDDIVYLARSLGFYTHLKKKLTNYEYVNTGEKAEAYIIKISGDTEEIPTILPRKKSSSTNQYNMRNSTGTIKIKEIDNENYVGIGIDGNNRFLINDFTVTHNCLNIRDASASQLINNEEINNLKQIIGLKQGKEYTSTKELRYGKVMILTDADCDGTHIKALLLNFFHYWWPSLVKLDFIQTLRTPIVKAIQGKRVLEFFTEQDYHKWQNSGINTKNYQIKYFKGLGTSKKEDAQDNFKRLDELKINYYYKDAKCDDSIILAFEKDKNVEKNNDTVSCSDQRKRWLAKYDKNSYIDTKEKKVSYQDLIHKELIHFSIYDNSRSIPSLCDGLKPSQRKILHYMLKNNITKPIKVAQLSGYVSAETGYHHGEASLQGAIVNMAQDFVGTNNINLLYPDGNHGTRLIGGKDAASPRYIFTKLCDITQLIFDKKDLALLTYLNDDGMSIEPEWFMPIIPMVLVNGCEGIGTGYSTFIPPYNPKDIIGNLLRVLDDGNPLPMTPYFRNFNGVLLQTEPGSYITKGKWERLSDAQIKITELPVGCWVTTYKEFLESLIENNNGNSKTTNKKSAKQTIVLKDVQNKTRDENDNICFIVEFKNSKDLDELINTNTLEKFLKLTKPFGTNNMYLFSDDLVLTKYKTPDDILLDFYDIRIEYYKLRRNHLIKCLDNDLLILNSKIRFINAYMNGDLDINRKTKSFIIQLLEDKKYPKITSNESSEPCFDYLIRMQLISLSFEKIKELELERDSKQTQLTVLKSKTDKDLWKDDLDKLSKMI